MIIFTVIVTVQLLSKCCTKYLQPLVVNVDLLAGRIERVERLLLSEVPSQPGQTVATARREGDFFFAEMKEDVGGGDTNNHTIDVDQGRIGHRVEPDMVLINRLVILFETVGDLCSMTSTLGCICRVPVGKGPTVV